MVMVEKGVESHQNPCLIESRDRGLGRPTPTLVNDCTHGSSFLKGGVRSKGYF